jgi:hypothetical protein
MPVVSNARVSAGFDPHLNGLRATSKSYPPPPDKPYNHSGVPILSSGEKLRDSFSPPCFSRQLGSLGQDLAALVQFIWFLDLVSNAGF